MKLLAWVLAALLAWVYVRYALKTRPDMLILQTSITNDRMHDLLAEKHPIILDESIPSVKELLQSTFRYQYIASKSRVCLPVPVPTTSDDKKMKNINNKNAWHRCTGRYTLLHVHGEHGAIDVKHPHMQYDVLRVNMGDSRIMILPPRYWYRLVSTDVAQGDKIKAQLHATELYDLIHAIMMPIL